MTPACPAYRQAGGRQVIISYRQKDNKGDRWVSEFVEEAKKAVAGQKNI